MSDIISKGGAKSEVGKAIASKNAIRHGLLSKEVLLKAEDAATLDELRQGMTDELAPVGTLESFLVDRLVADMWRMRRALAVEHRNAIVAQEKVKHASFGELTYGSKIGLEAAIETAHLTDSDTEKVLRYLTAIERSFFRTLHEVQRLQAARNGESVPLPVALDVSMDAPVPIGE